MELELRRIKLAQDFTIGTLKVNGKFECWTCEDVVREPGVKIHGKTAIPYGRYEVVLTMSNRFKVILPLLLNVPMFEGIRIHPGNTAADTEGCILPGRIQLPSGVGESRAAFNDLMGKITNAINAKHEKVFIEIATS